MAGTEENTLALGEPNIIVKACVSLKRLLIVTFNIKAIRIQYIYIYIGYIYISGYIYIYIYIYTSKKTTLLYVTAVNINKSHIFLYRYISELYSFVSVSYIYTNMYILKYTNMCKLYILEFSFPYIMIYSILPWRYMILPIEHPVEIQSYNRLYDCTIVFRLGAQ